MSGMSLGLILLAVFTLVMNYTTNDYPLDEKKVEKLRELKKKQAIIE